MPTKKKIWLSIFQTEWKYKHLLTQCATKWNENLATAICTLCTVYNQSCYRYILLFQFKTQAIDHGYGCFIAHFIVAVDVVLFFLVCSNSGNVLFGTSSLLMGVTRSMFEKHGTTFYIENQKNGRAKKSNNKKTWNTWDRVG